MKVRIARGQSDNEVKLQKLQQSLIDHQHIIDDQSNNFEQVASSIAMLIENINMQLEAEAAEIIDRTNIALFGGQQTSKVDKIDVTNTTEKLKSFKNRAGSLFSPRVISPNIGFDGDETPHKSDMLP